MKRILKIFGFLVLSVLLLITILIIIISLSENKIAEITQNQISKSISASVDIEDLSFTVFKDFPYATVELAGVKIKSQNSEIPNKSVEKQDILNINRLYVSVKSIPIFKGIYEVENLEINDAIINYTVDSLGKSNIDFLLEQNTTTSSDTSSIMFLNLEKVELNNTTIYYDNDTLQLKAKIHFPELNIKANIENENLVASVSGKMKFSEADLKNTHLNKMEQASVSFDVTYESDTIIVNKIDAIAEGIQIESEGRLAFSENIFADLEFGIENINLGNVAKYIPEKLLKEYDLKDFGGILEISGNVNGIYSNNALPAVNLDFDFEDGFLKMNEYPEIKYLQAEGDFSNGQQQNLISSKANFKKIIAETENSDFDIVATISNFEKPKYKLKSKLNVLIDEFADFIPDSLAQNVSGEIVAEISTTGTLPELIDDKFINDLVNNTTAKLLLTNINLEKDTIQISDLSAKVDYVPGNIDLKNFNTFLPQWNLSIKKSSFNTDYSGEITDPQNLALEINSFEINSNPGSISGTAIIKNLEHPSFEFDGKAQINLEELTPFIPDSLVEIISGKINTSISTYGEINLDSIEYQINNILFNQSVISAEFRDIKAKLPDTLQTVEKLNGKLELGKNYVSINDVSGNAADIEFSIDSSQISNFYNIVFKNKNEDTLNLYVDLNLGDVDYALLEPLIESDSVASKNDTENSNQESFSSTENITEMLGIDFPFDVKGKFEVKSIRYDKMYLEDVSGKFHFKDSAYIIDQFKTNAFDGSTVNSIRYNLTKDNKQVIHLKNQVENMDVNKLLFAFDDFGYDSIISYKNLSGIFSTDMNSRFVFVNDTLITNDMRVLGNFKLKNGKLVDYKPAMEVSNFTGLKELDSIEMKTLDCDVFMFKNQLFVPITNIVSTSMDVSTFGMQSLDENYEYHLHLKLGEILRGKSEKLIEKQYGRGNEVTEEDLDRNTIKIIYAYKDGKKRIGFATRREQKKMELKIKTQQKMLELIFHPLLVSYETGVE